MGSQISAVVVTLARMASVASMVASMASVVLMASRATMVQLLVYGPEDLLVRRWSCNSGVISVVYELGQNSSKIWLCSTTILAEEDDGSRCSRRVNDVKVKKELMGCQLWASVVAMAWVATMASMAPMVWMAQGGTDVEVPLVPMMVASNGGDEWWRRMVASMGGVDGWRRMVASMVGVDGGLGSSLQRALTWKSLCVPVVRVTRTVVACSSSEQFAGYQWLLSLCLVLAL